MSFEKAAEASAIGVEFVALVGIREGAISAASLDAVAYCTYYGDDPVFHTFAFRLVVCKPVSLFTQFFRHIVMVRQVSKVV